MLILTRKVGETIMIGDDIKITVLDKNFTRVRIGIDAPRGTSVHREEIYDKIKEQERLAEHETPSAK